MIIKSVLTKHFKTNSLYKTPSQALGRCSWKSQAAKLCYKHYLFLLLASAKR